MRMKSSARRLVRPAAVSAAPRSECGTGVPSKAEGHTVVLLHCRYVSLKGLSM